MFHERIDSAENSHAYLVSRAGVSAAIDHSKLHRDDREAAMRRFRTKQIQVLVAVTALDEGVDVPDAGVAVIAAGSRSRRQRIQRLGRVLRPAEGKEALVLTILVRNTPEEAAVGGRDNALLGRHRVRHHRWPGVPVADAVADRATTYSPEEPEYSVEDLLTLLDLGLWEPGKGSVNRMPAASRRSSGGYSARAATFSANAWYPVTDVSGEIGIPEEDFERIRRQIRQAFRGGLDPTKAADLSLIHGSEIDAVRRQGAAGGHEACSSSKSINLVGRPSTSRCPPIPVSARRSVVGPLVTSIAHHRTADVE